MSLSSLFLVSILWLSVSSFAFSQSSFKKLNIPDGRFGPESFIFDKTGNGFITGVSGGKIMKYAPGTGFVDFALISESSNKTYCTGKSGTLLASKCGRPSGLGMDEKTGNLYIADSPRGLHVITPAGGLATKIADSVDGEPFKFLDGLDVDPTTGAVYFTSFSSKYTPIKVLIAVAKKDASGKLFKYDPSTKKIHVLLDGLSGAAGCAVSSDGSFVLVSEFIKSKIQRYWIKGPNVGKSEEFTSNVSNPDNIRRIGSSRNFWVASVVNKGIIPTNPSAVKISSDGAVLQTISLKDKLGNILLSEVNEQGGNLYLGSLTEEYAGLTKLENV